MTGTAHSTCSQLLLAMTRSIPPIRIIAQAAFGFIIVLAGYFSVFDVKEIANEAPDGKDGARGHAAAKRSGYGVRIQGDEILHNYLVASVDNPFKISQRRMK